MDHAGPSQLSAPLKHIGTFWVKEETKPFQNNNLLTVLALLITTDAMEVFHHMPSNTSDMLVVSNLTYPYTAKDGTCVFRKNIAVGYVRFGSYNITQGDEKEMAQRLYEEGPVSVSFQVITGFKNYAGGVYTVANCGKSTQDVNHAVLATGYGNESGKDFWNVKNSWGSTWGSSGYFKIERGTNMCAIAQCNAYPLIDRPGSI